jgi:hypothetical protein
VAPVANHFLDRLSSTQTRNARDTVLSAPSVKPRPQPHGREERLVPRRGTSTRVGTTPAATSLDRGSSATLSLFRKSPELGRPPLLDSHPLCRHFHGAGCAHGTWELRGRWKSEAISFEVRLSRLDATSSSSVAGAAFWPRSGEVGARTPLLPITDSYGDGLLAAFDLSAGSFPR